ncbi:phage tail spike protein [Staphylococcus rostri]
MIHILNYSGQIIDFFSRDDNAIIKAMYSRTADTETLNLVVLSSKGAKFKERNRVLIQDQNGSYREFIVDHAEDTGQYMEVECTASYLVDISTSKPIPAGQYEKMTVNQKLSETLRDSGWTVGDCDFAGIKTNSWTSVRTPLEMISQLETAHEVVADYEIVVDGYEVTQRLVNMRKPVPLFKGKEIVYGKDLLSMKRKVDFSEVKTALYAFGPEQENGSRIELIVIDDNAQEQLGLPQRYIWGVYEPETQDDNMTKQRLETLARTELNKHKSAAISYEVSVVNIEQEYPHEVIRFGDLVRIKNTDFTPALYAESEVIGFDLDLISGDCTYQFGKIVEFKESDLLKYFQSKLGYIQQKMNDKFTNVNTIVQESLSNELQHFERKILKSDEPPANPVNDTLWLDTSNPKVAVLRRYFNGEWHNATAEKASDVGAVTREQAMFSELTNAFINLNIQHSKLLKEVTQVVNSEYFVSKTLKADVQAKLNETIGVFNKIKSNLDSMTSETATIGKLVDTQAFFLEYREKLQALYTSVETAKRAIDARFKLLQSQYTDQKFNDAMNKVASVIPGGRWDASSQTLTSDIPDESRVSEITSMLMNSAIESIAQSMAETNQRIYDNTQSLNERLDSKAQELLTNDETSAQNLRQYTDTKTQQVSDDIETNTQNLRQYVDTQKISLKDEVDNQFKLTTSEFSNAIKATKESIVNDVTKPLSIRLNTAESGLQQLQDSLLLTATKTEVNRMLTDQLTPLKTEVNKQQAQLKVMTDSINSKVSKSDYTADKNGIVERLNNADSERQQLSDEINDRVTLEEFKSTQLGTRNLLVGTEDLSGFKGIVTKIEKDGHTFGLLKKPDFSQVWMSQNVKVEPNTDYTLSFYAFKNGTDKAEVYTAVRLLKDDGTDFSPIKTLFNSRTAPQFVTDRVERYSKTFRVEDYTWIRVYFTSIDGSNATLPYISRPQLEKSKWMSDYKKAEEDVETSLTKLETKVSQNGREINAKASTEELNASKRTLSRVLADLTLNTTTGITLKYDENGNIQSHTIGPDGVKINASKIEINEGDVVIQNGRTTIKNLSSEKIKVAFNGITNSVNITPDGLETSSSGVRTSLLDGTGHHFFDGTNYVGNFGATFMKPGNQKGISLNLADYGQFMAFSYRTNKLKETDPNNVAMMWSKGFDGHPKGFLYNEDIVINNNHVLEAAYIRPFNAPIEHRLFLSARQTDVNEYGASIQYNNKDSSAIVFTKNAVRILGYDDKTKSLTGLNVYRNYITSETIFNRTYSSAANMFITSYGTLGRSTSASKYKLSQERQFKDDNQQYEHSKQILGLDIKTWFDKFEAETYAKEIYTGERQEEEDFKLKRYAGLIAEDVEAVGLNEFVTRGKDDEIEGIEYDRLWIHLIPIVKKQMQEIEKLKAETEVLKNGK